jgi:D-beta-D-heptose 7-phosphate kinase/D-beta-D-heptose 1-phosphate adenosyltransferase
VGDRYGFLTRKKVKTRSQILSFRKAAKKKGKRVVFTNGCFDLLHAGHVDYLERARSLGDYLVIAVNSDASVKRLKGSTRPLNGLSDRMRVLAALACVDCVVSFSEDTPLRLIQELTPDVLVKGGDYRIAEVVGGEWTRSHGGTVRVLPFLKGKSTTKIIKRANRGALD